MVEYFTNDLILFFLQLAAMLTVALVFGQLMRPLHLPPVLGELIGGVLLGPTLFGYLAPDIFHRFFPATTDLNHVRETLIRLGMLFFLFSAGLEINLARFQQQKWRILVISILGGAIPFALGFSSVWYFPDFWHAPASGKILNFALFIGTALSISALPVITRILLDFNLLQHEMGLVIMSAVTINDLMGWSFFAILLGSLNPSQPTKGIFNILGGLIFFAMTTLGLIYGLGKFALPWVRRKLSWPSGLIGVITIAILTAAVFAEILGVHAIFGAFLVGIALHQVFEQNLEKQVKEIMHQFAISFFAPLYFVSIGLKVDFLTHFDPVLTLTLVGLASVGKILGAGAGAYLTGAKIRKSLAIGITMNARGAMEIILASVALEYHLIDERLFVALVIMAFLTTLLSIPGVKWLALAGGNA